MSKSPRNKKKLALRTVCIDRLVLDPRNVKEHTEEQIEHLRASIRQYGFCDPIGVDDDFNVLEGHARYHAALAEGMAEVPVVLIGHLSEAERKAYAIAHNQTQHKSGLEIPVLNAEVVRLQVADHEFPSLGFTEADVMFMSAEDVPYVHHTHMDGDGSPPSQWEGLVSPVHKTTVRFSGELQYVEFVQLLDLLSDRYPTEHSAQDRLLRFISEYQQ